MKEEGETTRIEVGHGLGTGENAFASGANAARQALAGIKEHPLSAVLVFASVRYDLESLLRGIHSVVNEVPVLGATTAGEINDSPQRESVVVVALASPYLSVRVGVGKRVSQDWQQAVAEAVAAPGVSSFFSPKNSSPWEELTRQGKSALALMFSPGNTRHADSRSYEILEELKQLSQGRLPIFGGSAADDWRMEENYVLWGRQAYPDSLLVAVIETHLQFGIGLAHGFRPSSQQATITRARGHEVLELDGEPAAEVYARMLEAPRETLEGKHLTLTSGKPAGTLDPYGQYSLNVASYFTPEAGVRFSQPPPQGTVLTIMEADRDNLLAAGQEALRKALLRGAINKPAVVLVCPCALRSRILGEDAEKEIAGMKEMLPSVPLVGFYSSGEQGLADDGVNRHNNEVVSVLVLGQELSYAAQVALENQRLRAELGESEQRFRGFVESMDDVVFTLDQEQRHTGVFGRWVEKSGLTLDAFLGKTAREIMGAEAAGVHERANERTLAGEHVVYEWSIETDEGTEHYQTSLSPLQDSQGTVTGLVGVGRDITRRRRLEKQIEGLNRLQENLLGPGSFDEKLKQITEGTIAILGADLARIWIVRPGDLCDSGCFHASVTEGPHVCRHKDRCLCLVASSGRYTHTDGQVHRRVPFGCYKIGRIAAGQDPKFFTNDVANDSRVHDRAWAKELGLVSFAGYQLLSAAGKPIGVLALFAKHAISPEQDVLLEGLANSTAQLIQTATAEEALRQREREFKTLVENAPDMIVRFDQDFRHTYVNPAVEEELGISPQSILGKSYREMGLPDDEADWAQSMIRRVFETGQAQVFEASIPTSSGVKAYLSRGVPEFAEDGSVESALFIYRDVTERLQAEEALRASEALLNESQAIAHVGSWELDLVANRLTWSDEVYSMFGLHPQEFGATYEAFLDAVHPDDRGAVDAAYSDSLREGRDTYEIEHRIVRRDSGEIRAVHEKCEHVRDASGRVVRSVGIVQDITERKQAEKEREELIHELEDYLTKVQTLSGLLPICASCKKIRDDKGYWTQVEVYIREHAKVEFSHGLCPDCQEDLYPPEKYPFLYEDGE